MPLPRDEIVGRVLADVSDTLARAWALYDVSDAERDLVCKMLATAFLPSPVATSKDKDPLDMDLRDLYAIKARGRAAAALEEMFPTWTSWPSKPVADWLKVSSEARVIKARAWLRDLE